MKGVAIILNGGRASRIGGWDKAGIEIDNQTSFARLRDLLSNSQRALYVSVQAAYSTNEYEGAQVIPDAPALLPAGSKNPGAILAILSCLEWAQRQNDVDYIITSPSDTPYLPNSYCDQLLGAWKESGCANLPVVASSNERIHGLHALWPTACYNKIYRHIASNGERKLSALHKKLGSQIVNFETTDIDPFFNINTPEDLAKALKASDIS